LELRSKPNTFASEVWRSQSERRKSMDEFKKHLKDTVKLNHQIRYDGLYKITKILSRNKLFNKDMETIIGCSTDIETVIYNKSMSGVDEIYRTIDSNIFMENYSDELRHILINFDNLSHVRNKDLANLLKVHTLKEICEMKPASIFPSLWESTFEDMRKQEESKERDTTDTGMKCRRCGSHDLSISQSQTRSADEGSTIMTTCNNCGNVKKSGG